jgi:hypothetical protein
LKQRACDNLTNPILDVGMHSLRVTFCLWVVLCKKPRSTNKKNARHKSDDLVDEHHAANAQNIRLEFLKNPELFLKQKLGPPQDVLLITGYANQSKRVNQMNENNNQVAGLPEAAQLFVEKMLHVSPLDSNHRNKEHLLQLRHGMTFTGTSPSDLNAMAVVESMLEEWRHKAAQLHLAHNSLPLPCRMKVLEGLNRSQVPTVHQVHQPPFNRTQVPQAIPTPNHQPQAQTTTLAPNHQLQSSAGQAPFIPLVMVLMQEPSLTNSSRQHSVSPRCHAFGGKPPKEQRFFLFQVV